MAESKTLKLLLLGEDRSASKTIRGVGVEAGKTGSKLDAFGGKGKAAGAIVGGALAAGALVAVDALVQFSGAAIDAASAAQQSLGGVEAVFGKQAGAIKEASAAAAKDLGLSKTAYQELATVLGAGLKNKGIKDFGKETQNLITIGADLAAQYGGDSKTAVEALASAMRGESDPIERYGVSLSESAVKAELAARGQDKLKGKALETAKAAARLAIITKQTADAHGAFGRESDTLAGKQARVAAQYANMQERIGTGLLPMMEKLTQAGMDVLDWMEQNPEVMDALIGSFSAMGDIIVWVAGTLYKALIPSIKNTLTTVAFLTNGLADMLDAISNMPGMEWLKPAAKGMRELATGAAEVASAINKLPPELNFDTKPAQTSADKATGKVKKLRTEMQALKDKIVRAEAKGTNPEKVRALKAELEKLKKQYNTTVRTTIKWIYNGPPVPIKSLVPIAGARASGGPVSAGKPYLVGEKGPEIVTFPSNGFVHDADATAAMSMRGGALSLAAGGGSVARGDSIVNHYSISVQGDSDPDGAARRIIEKVRAFERRTGRQYLR